MYCRIELNRISRVDLAFRTVSLSLDNREKKTIHSAFYFLIIDLSGNE